MLYFFLRFLDVQGEWIRRVFSPQNQIRLGVVMTDLGVLLSLIWPLVARGEPPLIYEMSALALVFGGIGVIVTAVLAKDAEDASDEVERHHPEAEGG